MRKSRFFVLLFLFATGAMYSQSKNWNIDRGHSNIKFTVIHNVIAEVEGHFNDFTGLVTSPSADDFDGSDVEFAAQVVSINTGSERRDNHLKSDDFFSAEQFPEIKFKGKIEKEGDAYFLVGDFTMRDVTKAVKFDLKYHGSISTSRGTRAGFRVSGSVDRFEYGLKWDRSIEAGGLVVGKDVGITCNVELIEQRTQ